MVANAKGAPCWSVTFPDRVNLFCAIILICDKQVNNNSTHTIFFIYILVNGIYDLPSGMYVQGEMISLWAE
jgi:hypothetical protein